MKKITIRSFIWPMLILTQLIRLLLPWSYEVDFSFNVFGVSILFAEVWMLLILIYKTLNLGGYYSNNIERLLLQLVFVCSLVSSFANWDHQSLADFFISQDFVLSGLILSFFNINTERARKILSLLCASIILYICIQSILFPLGLISIDVDYSSKDAMVRVGTSVGSSISTSYMLIKLCALFYLLTPKSKWFSVLLLLTITSVLLSLSRGPIIELGFALLFIFLSIKKINFKFLRYSFGIVIILALSLFQIDKQTNFIRLLSDRATAKDVTSGRDIRWHQSLNVYNESSILFGAGNNLVPTERRVASESRSNLDRFVSPHNFYISFLVENGIIGVFLIFVLIIFIFYNLFSFQRYYWFSTGVLFGTLIFEMNLEVTLRNSLHSSVFWAIYFFSKSLNSPYFGNNIR